MRARRVAAVADGPPRTLAHAELARASESAGSEEEARAHARRAFEPSGSLPREQRLLVAAEHHLRRKEFPQSVESFRALHTVYRDSVDYGLRLADAQIAAGQGQGALATVAELQALPAPASDDPRIAYMEARAAHGLSNYQRCLDRRPGERARRRPAGRPTLSGRDRAAGAGPTRASVLPPEGAARNAPAGRRSGLSLCP